MKIWAISNQKGGVGKTTTVVTLGGLLSSWGFKTLLIDLDPHGSLTSYFKMNPDETKTSVYNLFHDASQKKKNLSAEPYIVKTEFVDLSLLPASTAIATLDRQVAAMGGMGMVISSSLKQVAASYDYVLIDSPPMLGVLMINALAACDHLIIPVLSEYLALKGLDRMLHTIGMVFKSRKVNPRYTIIPTMFDKRTRAARESLISLRLQYPDTVWKSFVPVDTKVREASQAATPLSLFVKDSKAVQAYTELLELLLPEDQHFYTKAAVS